jgi:diadenosine tetraphosphate (Ap4A) HIT family hydrolase
MSFHSDYSTWARMTDPSHCPICNSAPMPEGMEDLYELPNTWLDSEPSECLRGACHVVSKHHAVELYDLSDTKLLGVMREVAIYAHALRIVTGAVKINYEIHGNTVPHLHVHLYPRHCSDPFAGVPIDYNSKQPDLYGEGEYELFVRSMRRELDRLIEA